MKPNFQNNYSTLQRQIIDRLAEIEQSDADACANCGGEDCICCEIYHDRQRWVSPNELFGIENDYDPAADWHDELRCPVCHQEITEDDEAWECDCGNICHESCTDNNGECGVCRNRHGRYDNPYGNPFAD